MHPVAQSADNSPQTPKPRIKRFDRAVDGILLLDKPAGISSNAALQQARVIFRALKAGHAGSLDPLATGMLPICFGEATKVCNWLLDASKSYRFLARLGERTDTGDAEGKVIECKSVPQLSIAQITATLQSMLGEQTQVPPMYSALKHQGQRLYALARRGESVERAPRKIVVSALELLNFDQQMLEITVRCSKGTYVRTLAEDIAARLGTTAHLTALRRLEVAPFLTDQMRTLEQLQEEQVSGLQQLDTNLLASDLALQHLPAITCDAEGQIALLQGKTIRDSSLVATGDIVRLYGPQMTFLGVGEALADGWIHPRRLWNIGSGADKNTRD